VGEHREVAGVDADRPEIGPGDLDRGPDPAAMS